jgi:hypothetical protein
MLCGAVAMVNIMMAVRDRAQDGHSDYENPFLAATDYEQVDERFRLYSPEVQKIQNAPTFGTMTSNLRVKDLLYVVFSAWVKTNDALMRNEVVTWLGKTAFGHSLRMRTPLVRHENSEASLKRLTSSKQCCNDN